MKSSKRIREVLYSNPQAHRWPTASGQAAKGKREGIDPGAWTSVTVTTVTGDGVTTVSPGDDLATSLKRMKILRYI